MGLRTAKQDRVSELRETILNAARALIAEAGIEGVSMRKLSQSVGASTTVLYTYFKNKQDILNELFLAGYQGLREKLEAVPPGDDPVDHVLELGRAYRRNALNNSEIYQLMMDRSVPGFTPPEESLDKCRESFGVLAQAVARCVELGLVPPEDPEHVAQMLWGVIHGQISLQLYGHYRDDEAAAKGFETAMAVVKRGLTAPVTPATQNQNGDDR